MATGVCLDFQYIARQNTQSTDSHTPSEWNLFRGALKWSSLIQVQDSHSNATLPVISFTNFRIHSGNLPGSTRLLANQARQAEAMRQAMSEQDRLIYGDYFESFQKHLQTNFASGPQQVKYQIKSFALTAIIVFIMTEHSFEWCRTEQRFKKCTAPWES